MGKGGKAVSGRKSRDKGLRFERELVNRFQEAGFAAERIPLSGATGGSFAGDLTIPILNVDRLFEAKKRAGGFKMIYDYLKDHYGLFIAQDRAPHLVVLRLDDFLSLAQAAELSPVSQRRKAA